MHGYDFDLAVARVDGPLAWLADGFLAALLGQGYCASSVYDHLGLMAQFSAWLDAQGLELSQVSAREVERFAEVMRATRRTRVTARSLGRLLAFLRAGELLAEPGHGPVSGGATLVRAFGTYLSGERRLGEATIRKYTYFAADFLERLGEPVEARLAGLTGAEVLDVVLAQVGRFRGPSMAEAVVANRALLRFCYLSGRIGQRLDHLVPSAARRPPGLPRRLDEEVVTALLASCDRGTEKGCRDHAALVLLRRYGVRGIEVSRLRLEDLRWRAGEIVVRGKGGRIDVLPLMRDAGQALVAYLHRRPVPPPGIGTVFVTVQAPRRPLTIAAVSGIVRQACRRAGIAPFGTRPFRHGLGCDLLGAGASLEEIAEVLRHGNIATTAGYARVDMAALSMLVRPWPGSGPDTRPDIADVSGGTS